VTQADAPCKANLEIAADERRKTRIGEKPAANTHEQARMLPLTGNLDSRSFVSIRGLISLDLRSSAFICG
jgi:hypothetical protein